MVLKIPKLSKKQSNPSLKGLTKSKAFRLGKKIGKLQGRRIELKARVKSFKRL